MALFDRLKNNLPENNNSDFTDTDTRKVFVFNSLPETYEDFISLPEAGLASPFETTALTVIALCFYPDNRELSLNLIDYLRGPRKLNGIDKQFIADRFRDKDYVPRSYFKDSVPENNYIPSEPYTLTVEANNYSFDEEGYAKLYVSSGGADSPRSVQTRLAKDGKWYLWEQYLLSGIRLPSSADPWA